MTTNEIETIKTCAGIIAKRYNPLEPWISPNSVLAHFGLPEWELCEDFWYDPETGVNYPVAFLQD